MRSCILQYAASKRQYTLSGTQGVTGKTHLGQAEYINGPVKASKTPIATARRLLLRWQRNFEAPLQRELRKNAGREVPSDCSEAHTAKRLPLLAETRRKCAFTSRLEGLQRCGLSIKNPTPQTQEPLNCTLRLAS